MVYGKLLAMSAAIAITSGALFLLASPASGKAPIVITAPSPENLVTRHIPYADLNLASVAGEGTLKRRVGSAVDYLCSEATGGYDGSLRVKFATMSCDNSAWLQARPQISRAVRRAHESASTGASTIAGAAITIAIPE